MEIASLDPIRQTNNWEYMTAVNVYDTLVFPDPEKKVVPWIAESWEVSPDKTSYTFKLKHGVPFHDGKEITSADVAFSMQRLLAMSGPIANYFKSIDAERIETPDPYTVRFNLKAPDPAFMQALFLFKILNKDLLLANKAEGKYGEYGDYGAKFLQSHDAGSGPYKVVDFRPSEAVVLERFADYPFSKAGSGTPESVRILTIPEVVTIAAKLKGGELDVGTVSIPTQVQKQLASDERFVVERDPQPTPWFVVMNNAKPPLDDPHVRRAVAYAYDANTVTKFILGGGEELRGPVPPQLLGKCEGITRYDFSLEKAKQELAQSKYTPEQLKAFEMDIAAVAGSERFKNIALLLSTNLKKIGLNAQVKAVRWSDITAAQTKPETAFNFVVYYDTAKVPHPNQFLTYYTKKGWGASYPPGGIYYDNPKVTALIQQANDANDPAESQKLVCEAVKLIAEDSPSVFSHVDVRQFPHWRYVKGFKADAGAMFFDLRFDRFSLDAADPLLKQAR
ncbi:ABC transporter substrate-binding protein [Xanthobacter sp. ZOL 2024]